MRLGDLNREIDRLVDATARGHRDPAVLGPRSSVLDEARKQVARQLNDEPAVGDAISLHPAALARYEQQLVHPQDALLKGADAGDSEAAEAIRELVETVTLFRTARIQAGSRLRLSDA